MIRIAFRPFGDERWLGGFHYLATLLSALHEHAATRVEAVLLVSGSQADERLDQLRPYLSGGPVSYGAAADSEAPFTRTVSAALRRRDAGFEDACRRERIDLAFQHADWLGSRFSIPSLAWLGDFQHRVVPEMFSTRLSLRRELRFRAVMRSASLLYVLSEADLSIGHRFYPRFAPKIRSLPFAVGLSDQTFARDPLETREKYSLPSKFVLFPGQFWKHKNHLNVLEALSRLKHAGLRTTVVSCGNPTDFRDPSFGPLVMRRVAELDLDEDFRVLGVVPRTDLWGLLRASSAVLNPSLYEGWSTPVEEAKSIGAPLVISDLAVHREQRPHVAYFFDPLDPESIADALSSAWDELPSGPRPDEERRAAAELIPRRQAFADRFVELANEAITRGRA